MTQPATDSPSNFADLHLLEPLLAQLGRLAERYVVDDPNTALLKLRQFGELLSQVVAARSGQLGDASETQQLRLARLQREGVLPREVWQLLTELRRSGNEANHAFTGEHQQALELLKFAWIVGVWLLRTFHDPESQRGDFIEPQSRQNQGSVEAAILQALLTQAEEGRTEAERRLAEQQALAPKDTAPIVAQARLAADHLNLNEAQTRQLIDTQLRAVGWEVDTEALTYGKGTRPEKGRNLAIAEWPTSSGPADYALFVGMTPVGVVEAKRKNRAVMGSLEQAARYSRTFQLGSV